jgi:hypothetical protein
MSTYRVCSQDKSGIKKSEILKRGDVVLLKDNDLARNQWSMGRIVTALKLSNTVQYSY